MKSIKLVAVFSVIAFLVAACSAADPGLGALEDRGATSALTGDVQTIDGATVSLGDFQNSDLVVWFWAPW